MVDFKISKIQRLQITNEDPDLALDGIGIVVKSVIATDKEYQPLFTHLVANMRLSSFVDFTNEAGLFPAVHRQERFALITLVQSGASSTATYAFMLRAPEELGTPGRKFVLSEDEVRAMSGGSCRLPTVDCPEVMNILLRAGQSSSGCTFIRVANGVDSYILYDGGKVASVEGACTCDSFLGDGSDTLHGANATGEDVVGVYEGKLFGHLDHRLKTFGDIPADRRYGKTPALKVVSEQEKQDPYFTVEPRYWVPVADVGDKLSGKGWGSKWLALHSRKANRDNRRTFSLSVTPLCGAVDVAPAVLFLRDNGACADAINAIAVGQTHVFDYIIRSRIIGFTIGKNLLAEIPCPPTWSARDPMVWDPAVAMHNWMAARVLELAYTSWDLSEFAVDLGYGGAPFRWDAVRRLELFCELDATYAHLYGLDRNDVEFIMESFPKVRSGDEKAHGYYRTKDTILDIYDEMAEAKVRIAAATTDAERRAAAYKPRLDPPPGPPADAAGNFIPYADWTPEIHERYRNVIHPPRETASEVIPAAILAKGQAILEVLCLLHVLKARLDSTALTLGLVLMRHDSLRQRIVRNGLSSPSGGAPANRPRVRNLDGLLSEYAAEGVEILSLDGSGGMPVVALGEKAHSIEQISKQQVGAEALAKAREAAAAIKRIQETCKTDEACLDALGIENAAEITIQ